MEGKLEIFYTSFFCRYHQQAKGPHPISPVFRVRLTVGSIEVMGEGSTAQAAKHAAATNALIKLKVCKKNEKFTLS